MRKEAVLSCLQMGTLRHRVTMEGEQPQPHLAALRSWLTHLWPLPHSGSWVGSLLAPAGLGRKQHRGTSG